MSSNHTWNFVNVGGFSQARMESAADFANLGTLDQKLWAALACPVKGLAFDSKTLSLLDHDNDGRIRAPEVIEAARWCTEALKNLDALARGGQPLAIDNIDTSHDVGANLAATARQILTSQGKEGGTLAVADAAAAAASLAKSALNGDGVIPAAAATDPAVATLIGEIVATRGGAPDRSGEDGVDQAGVDAFWADAQAVVDWHAAATVDVRALGDGTEAAADAIAALKAKVDDFFARCRLAAFDERAITALNRREEEYLAIAAEDLSVTADEVAGFPLARVEAGAALPLTGGVNPAWAARLDALRTAAAIPLLGEGKDSLTEDEWKTLQERVAPFEAWRGAKPATPVHELSVERLREILGGTGKDDLAALIAQDLAMAPQVDAVDQVERLVRYHRDLLQLARNFVNLSDFYSDEDRASFEAGTLYLDGRECELVVRVDDAAKHKALAGKANLYLAYCNCTRPSGEKMAIAAAFTDGDSDYLMVGRNGVFYDRDGKDWDATITSVVDNPISLRQAFWSPYKKLTGFVEDLAAKRAAAKEAEVEKSTLAKAGETAGKPGETPKAPGIDVGVVAAIAVGLGALGSMAVAIIGYITGLFSMPFWIIVLVVLALFLAISMPSVVVAYFKLRKRSLGPVLDANGWAINGRAKVSVPFGRTMTRVAKLPPGARVDSRDKYADPSNPWPGLLLTLVVIGFVYSLLNFFGVIYELSGGLIGDEANTMQIFPVDEAVEGEAVEGEAAAVP